jgi:hypothetical protein
MVLLEEASGSRLIICGGSLKAPSVDLERCFFMKCTKPIRIMLKKTLTGKWKEYPTGLEVPCGKCTACRIQRRQEWAMRLLHELSYHKDSIFLTLTYEDVCLPPNGSLSKDDLQKFIKRLRKFMSPRKLKYFACGEYGGITTRPHYHLIVFGVPYTYEQVIMDIWKRGFIKVGSVTEGSIMYCAKYVEKDVNGDLEDDLYCCCGLQKPFRVSSNGLGKQWAIDNVKHIIDNKCIYVNGIPHSIPKYYIDLLKLDVEQFKDEAKEVSRQKIKKYTGKYLSPDEFYRFESVTDNIKLDVTTKKHNNQREKNLSRQIDIFNDRKL